MNNILVSRYLRMLKDYWYLGNSSDNIRRNDIAEFLTHNWLYLRHRNICKVDHFLSTMGRIEGLDISENLILSLDGCLPKNLKRLLANGNHIVAWPAGMPVSIELIDLSWNRISSVPDISHLKNLKHLRLTENPIGPNNVNVPEHLKDHKVDKLFWYIGEP